MKDNDEYRHLSNASSLIRIVSKRLQTQEFLMMIKNKWSEGRLSDVKRSGDSFQRTFERLKRLAIRLQKTFGADYQSDNMMCDFYSRALQDEPFWTWVYDYEPNITSDKMCGKIVNAIVKYERLRKSKMPSSSASRTVTVANAMATTMTNRRFAVPDSRRRTPSASA